MKNTLIIVVLLFFVFVIGMLIIDTIHFLIANAQNLIPAALGVILFLIIAGSFLWLLDRFID